MITRSFGFVILGLLLGWMSPTSLRAQIVNVAPSLAAGSKSGLSGDLAQSLEWKTGNTRSLIVKGGLKLRYVLPAHRVQFLASGQYSSFGGSAFDRQVMEHLRYRYDPLEWLGLEAFGQHEYSEFRRLSLRALAGAGLQLRMTWADQLSVALGSAYMFEHERLDHAEDGDGTAYADAGDNASNHRWSNYLLWTWHLAEHLSFLHSTYLQPRFGDFEDLRVLSELGIKVRLLGNLSLKVAATLAYDSRPPMGVKKLDTALVNSLSWSFGPWLGEG